MSERIQQDKESVVDAVVSGDADRLWRSLQRLSESCPGSFMYYTSQLINREQLKQYPSLGLGVCVSLPPFYFEDGIVYGAIYTQGEFLLKNAHRSGVGIAYDAVARIVEKARTRYDENVLKKVCELKAVIAEIDRLLPGHSLRNEMLSCLAKTDLVKGQAMMVAALAVPQLI